jgi:hypothetical protein
MGEIAVDASSSPAYPKYVWMHIPGIVIQLRAEYWPGPDVGGPVDVEELEQYSIRRSTTFVPVNEKTRYFTGRHSLKHRDGPVLSPMYKSAVPGTWNHIY